MTQAVSIIIPVKLRNPQELIWFEVALESLLKQDHPLHVVIVNDHSVISPAPVISKFADTFKAMYVIDLKNKTGLAAARNAGVELSNTRHFFPLDADDWLADHAIDLVMAESAKTKFEGFTYGSTVLWRGDIEITYKAHPYDFAELMQHVYWPNGCLQLKSNWEKIGGWDETLQAYEDWDYWLRSGEAGICGTHIPDVLYYYRNNPNGITATLRGDTRKAEAARQAVHLRHESIYKGAFPMGCCGSHRVINPTPGELLARKSAVPLVGAAGFVLIQYTGNNAAKVPYYGSVTRTRYVFSSGSRLSYVDARDVPGLLDTRIGQVPIFCQATDTEILQVDAANQAAKQVSPAFGEMVVSPAKTAAVKKPAAKTGSIKPKAKAKAK